jgi:molecular chaperone GrpE
MSDEKNPSGKSTRNPSADGAQTGQTGTVDNQHRKKFEIQVEGREDHSESPPMEELEERAEVDLEAALSRLEEAEEMVRKHQEDMLRVQAEMQNLRRRTEQDIEKAHKYGQERFVTELLTVIDNLERALDAARVEEEGAQAGADSGLEKLKAIREGVDLTLKSLLDCFRKFSIEAIDPLGEPFDPLLHQAMATVEDPKVEPNTVTVVMQKGYLLHGRVIRPAMVMVSK